MVDKQALQQESIYHIRVKGTLDEKWADWFEGFVMESRGNGETLLTGAVVDQAALQGVLARIHSLGLPLLLVAQTGCPCSKRNCPRRGQCHECAAYHGANGKLPYCFRAKTGWDKKCIALTRAK
ncbi:MAG: hypothetical protein PVF77_06320 [Anaerolineae bacterium]|jgi:hypothetical protein